MRVSDEIKKCVVFLGHAEHYNHDTGIRCEGTGFLLSYDGLGYLVTARHVAHNLQDIGWVVRLNKPDGTCKNMPAESISWTYHQDDGVDLAVTTFGLRGSQLSDFSITLWQGDVNLLTSEKLERHQIGPGDPCYTVGLFHLLVGQKRPLSVIHVGNISLLPGDERVPVENWERKTKLVEAYLIETQSLPGLSGSPVFVRSSFNFSGLELTLVDGS